MKAMESSTSVSPSTVPRYFPIGDIERGLCVVRAAIGRDHAILAVSAAGIASKIEKGNIPIDW